MKPSYYWSSWFRGKTKHEKQIPAILENAESIHFNMRVKLKQYLKGNTGVHKFISSCSDDEINYFLDCIFNTGRIKIEKNNISFLCLRAFFIYIESLWKFMWSQLLISGNEDQFFKTLYKINPLLKQSYFTRIIYNKNG